MEISVLELAIGFELVLLQSLLGWRWFLLMLAALWWLTGRRWRWLALLVGLNI